MIVIFLFFSIFVAFAKESGQQWQSSRSTAVVDHLLSSGLKNQKRGHTTQSGMHLFGDVRPGLVVFLGVDLLLLLVEARWLGARVGVLDLLDDADSNGLAHVTDGETSERWELREGLDAQGLGGDEDSHASLAGLDGRRELLLGLTRTRVDLGDDGVELARDVSGVAIEDRGVTVSDTLVVEDDNLGEEAAAAGGGVVLGGTANVTTLDVLDGQTLDGETDVVSGTSLGHLLVVHLDGLALSGLAGGGEGDGISWLEDTCLDTADWNGSDTLDLATL